jgi:hypothetical protein
VEPEARSEAVGSAAAAEAQRVRLAPAQPVPARPPRRPGAEADAFRRRRGRRRRWSTSSLLVLRVLLLADGLIVAVVGGIAALFVERPAGLVVAFGAWILAGILFCCLPLTDPYRREDRG